MFRGPFTRRKKKNTSGPNVQDLEWWEGKALSAVDFLFFVVPMMMW
jgi:hypothetical protein